MPKENYDDLKDGEKILVYITVFAVAHGRVHCSPGVFYRSFGAPVVVITNPRDLAEEARYGLGTEAFLTPTAAATKVEEMRAQRLEYLEQEMKATSSLDAEQMVVNAGARGDKG